MRNMAEKYGSERDSIGEGGIAEARLVVVQQGRLTKGLTSLPMKISCGEELYPALGDESTAVSPHPAISSVWGWYQGENARFCVCRVDQVRRPSEKGGSGFPKFRGEWEGAMQNILEVSPSLEIKFDRELDRYPLRPLVKNARGERERRIEI